MLASDLMLVDMSNEPGVAILAGIIALAVVGVYAIYDIFFRD